MTKLILLEKELSLIQRKQIVIAELAKYKEELINIDNSLLDIERSKAELPTPNPLK